MTIKISTFKDKVNQDLQNHNTFLFLLTIICVEEKYLKI